MAQNTYTSERAQRNIRLMLLHMSDKAYTIDELADKLCLSWKTVGGYVRHLRAAKDKRIHIRRWITLEAVGGRQAICFAPTYMAGNQDDAPRPKTNQAERCRLYRQKIAADEDRLARVNARRRAKRIQPRSDPLVDLLFGRLAA